MDLPRRTVDAIRNARDQSWLIDASEGALAGAAILIAGAVVKLETRGGRRELQAQAFKLLDDAGLRIADELRRRAGPA